MFKKEKYFLQILIWNGFKEYKFCDTFFWLRVDRSSAAAKQTSIQISGIHSTKTSSYRMFPSDFLTFLTQVLFVLTFICNHWLFLRKSFFGFSELGLTFVTNWFITNWVHTNFSHFHTPIFFILSEPFFFFWKMHKLGTRLTGQPSEITKNQLINFSSCELFQWKH